MRTRSNKSGDPPFILSLFVALPWYCGPIAAAMAYAILRWVAPWVLPLPKAELKSVDDGIALMFASFAQAGPRVAPIAAAVVLFAWGVAELMKFAKRVRDRPVSGPPFGQTRPDIDDGQSEEPARMSADRPRKERTNSDRRLLRDSATNVVAQQSTADIKQSKHSVPSEAIVLTSIDDREVDVSTMTWNEFEKLLVHVLRRFGFQAAHTGRNGPDGGVDVRCTDSKGQTILVQCKHWHHKEVGVTVIREFFGVLVHEGAARGLVVSSGLFTQEARKFAESKPLTLVDGEKLLKLLAELPEDKNRGKMRYRISHLETIISSQACPRCESRMIRKRGRRGFFLSCERYPDCDGSRDALLNDQ